MPLAVRCCIVGGGPAGMMLGFLLARAGIEVAVLEKHADFFRDFRGDTIHPSTLDLIAELGLLDAFLRLPHDEVEELSAIVNDRAFRLVDFRHLPTRRKALTLMPQWDFLNFLAEHAKRYPGFHLLMQAEVVDVLSDGRRVVGVVAQTPGGALEVRAGVTIGADGRTSTVRAKAELRVDDLGAPMDVLWMRLSRRAGDPPETFGYLKNGAIFVMIGRRTYWQCGYVIPKGSFAQMQERGLDAFRRQIADTAPFLADRLGEIDAWEKVNLLTVRLDRLREWCRDGLLCIGDAAHAMSPIGGVGVNLAVQDAVATANRLAGPLAAGTVTLDDLRAVQRRRMFPTRMTQAVQLFIQKRFIGAYFAQHARTAGNAAPTVSWILRLVQCFPLLRRIPAYAVGVGFRPEHVGTPEVPASVR